jgi:hypothetical protein
VLVEQLEGAHHQPTAKITKRKREGKKPLLIFLLKIIDR